MEGFISTLAYPWVLFSIPVFIITLFLKGASSVAPLVSSHALLRGAPRSLRQHLRAPVLYLLLVTGFVSLAISASRPQSILGTTEEKRRNLMLVLDVSPSMEAPDFMDGINNVTRLEGVKRVVQDFIAQRHQDRIGLVVFGGRSFLQSPLTTDHAFLSELVAALTPGLAGDGTAIGDGLGTALKRIKDLPAESKAVVLLTDGVNNAGTVDPLNAAEIALKLGIKVHTIGIGRDHSESISIQGFSVFAGGVEYDEKTLKMISEKTSGVYFNAGSTASLRSVYDKIDELVESEAKDTSNIIVEEHYGAWALVAFLALAAYGILHATLLSKV